MVTAIVAAAGQGKRMERGINKVFIPLLNRPVLANSVNAILGCPEVDSLIVVVAPGEETETKKIMTQMALTKSYQVVVGGSERQHSIANALAVVPETANLVVVHDGARPLVESSAISEVIAAARIYGAAVIAVPVKDTIKTVNRDEFVTTTLERSMLWAVQTPQVFNVGLIKEAYAAAARDGFLGTDDAMLVERLGLKVKVVKGRYSNLKITTPEDLVIAEALMGKGENSVSRVGIGYDVHQLVSERKLILGGVEVAFEQGLDGHSDADVLVHAVMDAILGAAALGDIGRHFPDSDISYKGVSSLSLLAVVRDLVAGKGWRTENIDAVIVAEKPKLAPFITMMNKNIAEVLGISDEQVNVKATTTEGLGFAGRKEGIAAHAVACIVRA
ncbi:MAG: ispDF [Firmicutes bacterium]|nr:ispDF [Bacillota bacterium]